MLADARNRRSHFLSATGRMSLAAFARQFSAMAHGIPVVLHLARRWGIRKPQSSSRSDRSHPDRARTSTIRGSHRQPERSEEHTSELQSLMPISYAVFCLKKKNNSRATSQLSIPTKT